MYYHIQTLLDMAPYASYTVLSVAFVICEAIYIKSIIVDGPVAERGRGTFVPPPGEGYELYIDCSTIVYVHPCACGRKRYQIYMISGAEPSCKMYKDRYGRYFLIHAEDHATAERLVERTFSNRQDSNE